MLKKFYGEQFWIIPPSSQVSKKITRKEKTTENDFSLSIFLPGKDWEGGWESLRFFLPYHPYFFLQEYHLREGIATFEFPRNFSLILSSSPENKDSRSRVINPSSLSSSICGLYSERGEELGLGIIQDVNEEKKTIIIKGTQLKPR